MWLPAPGTRNTLINPRVIPNDPTQPNHPHLFLSTPSINSRGQPKQTRLRDASVSKCITARLRLQMRGWVVGFSGRHTNEANSVIIGIRVEMQIVVRISRTTGCRETVLIQPAAWGGFNFLGWKGQGRRGPTQSHAHRVRQKFFFY